MACETWLCCAWHACAEEAHLNLICDYDRNAAEQDGQLETHSPAIPSGSQAEDGFLKTPQVVIPLHSAIHV